MKRLWVLLWILKPQQLSQLSSDTNISIMIVKNKSQLCLTFEVMAQLYM